MNIRLGYLFLFSFIILCSLNVDGQTPATAAPTPPARSASKVISIFCDAYSNIEGTIFNPYWNQLTQVATVAIEQNPTLRFSNFNYQGFELGTIINALPMTHLHVDVWSANESKMVLAPLSQSVTNENVTLNPFVKNAWNSYDIELSSVSPKWKSVSDIYQFFFQGNGGNTVYIDNIYFYNAMEGDDTTAPTGLTATAGLVTFNSIEVVLNASDNSGAVFYDLQMGETLVHLSNHSNKETLYTFRNLTDSTNYSISITAKDYVGNVSASSPVTLNLTTLKLPDAAPIPPIRKSYKVASVYSNTYENVPGTIFYPDWNQKTEVSEVEFAGNRTLKYDNLNYQGIELGSDINALPMTHLHIDVFTPNETSLGLYPVSRSKTNTKVMLAPLVTNTWNSFDIVLSDVKSKWLSVSDIYQFFIEGSGGKTVYIDNLYFYNSSDAEDTQVPDQVTVTVGLVMFNSIELRLKANDNSGAVLFEIVNGDQTYKVAGISGITKSVVINSLEGNTEYDFFVSVTDPTGNEAAFNPVNLTAKTLEALPAPTPTIGSENVISIFSNAYSNIENTNFNPYWNQSTQFTSEFIGSDEFLIYSNLNYQGIEFGKHIDATAMRYLHLDVWTPNETKLEVTVLSPGKEKLVELNPLTKNVWNSYDIPLSKFSGVNMGDLFQFKFVGSGGKTVYLDNFYFHNADLTANSKSFNDESIAIYPNPASGYFMLNSEVAIRMIRIYTPTGKQQKIFQLNDHHYLANVTDLQAGAYIVTIETADGITIHKKLIIQ